MSLSERDGLTMLAAQAASVADRLFTGAMNLIQYELPFYQGVFVSESYQLQFHPINEEAENNFYIQDVIKGKSDEEIAAQDEQRIRRFTRDADLYHDAREMILLQEHQDINLVCNSLLEQARDLTYGEKFYFIHSVICKLDTEIRAAYAPQEQCQTYRTVLETLVLPLLQEVHISFLRIAKSDDCVMPPDAKLMIGEIDECFRRQLASLEQISRRPRGMGAGMA